MNADALAQSEAAGEEEKVGVGGADAQSILARRVAAAEPCIEVETINPLHAESPRAEGSCRLQPIP